jgi:CDP-diglyceride synthetase
MKGSELIAKLNSAPMFLLGGIAIAFIVALSIVFLVKSYRAGLALGMEKKALRKAVTASATFTILPSVSILLGVIALGGSLGVPLPWVRLSVIGALHYEGTVADIGARNAGMAGGLTAAEMTGDAFVTIALLMTFFLASVNDVFALLVGVRFGKHRLSPEISPKKSIEGSIGGLIFATVACVVYALVMNHGFGLDMALWPAILFGIVGSTAGQIGDLSLSVIKRGAGIKDYGNLFPGHGGVWDRFDSILFAAPLFELLYLHILPRIGG